MNSTSINLSGKLPKGLVELYRDVKSVSDGLKIKVLIVGAMARDLVLVHGYGARLERGTRDVDFGISVATWEEFEALKAELIMIGFSESPHLQHRLARNDSEGLPWDIDIIPFGDIANEKNEISWPPNADVVMSVAGFDEALLHAMLISSLHTAKFRKSSKHCMKTVIWKRRIGTKTWQVRGNWPLTALRSRAGKQRYFWLTNC